MSEPTPNPFLVLGLPAKIPIDQDHLKKAYFALQQKAHPDRQSTESSNWKGLSFTSAQINHAYQQLKSLSTAAHALLLLKNSASTDENQPPELLMNLMDWEEKLNAAEGAEKETLLTHLENKQIHHASSFMDLYTQDPVSQEAQKQLKDIWLTLQYFERLITRHRN